MAAFTATLISTHRPGAPKSHFASRHHGFRAIRRASVLALAMLGALALQRPAAADPTTSPQAAEMSGTILTAVGSAVQAESFLLAPELNFLHRDKPRLHVWPIVTRGHDADSSQRAALLHLLGRARRDPCPIPPEHCGFDPTYGLRFHDASAPLDMLVSSDCTCWCFLRGEESEGGYHSGSPADGDSLRALIRHLFPNLRK